VVPDIMRAGPAGARVWLPTMYWERLFAVTGVEPRVRAGGLAAGSAGWFVGAAAGMA